MRVCNREISLHHGDLLIYSQTSVIFRGSQRSWPLVLVCTRILPCTRVSSITGSAPPVTVPSGWSGSVSYWASPPGDPVVPTLFLLSLFICHMFELCYIDANSFTIISIYIKAIVQLSCPLLIYRYKFVFYTTSIINSNRYPIMNYRAYMGYNRYYMSIS